MLGFFSATAAKHYGYAVWSRPDGTTTAITTVRETEAELREHYRWKDTVCVGEVVACVTPNPWVREHIQLVF